MARVARGGPRKTTLKILKADARLRASGQKGPEIAARLGVTSNRLRSARERHPGLAARLLLEAKGKVSAPKQATIEVLKADASLRAAGFRLETIAKQLRLKPDTLKKHRQKYVGLSRKFYEEAKARRPGPGTQVVIEQPTPYSQQEFPDETTREGIRKAAGLKAAGLEDTEVCDSLGIKHGTFRHWKDAYGELWQAEFDQAMETAVAIIRRQAGTEAVLKDPGAYVRQATTCDKWMHRKGQQLFPQATAPTIRSFYETYYRPIRHSDAAPTTIRDYRDTIRYWVAFTGDPPLVEITVETLALFKECLTKMSGRKRTRPMSANSIRKHLRELQAVLDKAGPPMHRNRDAAGILDHIPPWIKPPRQEFRPPRIVTMDDLNAVYLATVAMEVPNLWGIKPPAWWKALLVVAFNTGLRKGDLLGMRMDAIDWQKHCVTIPPARSKTGHGQALHLNATVIRHLMTIRTDRELVFEWPRCMREFDRKFHELQEAAGIPKGKCFGLHALRKSLATLLWEVAPAAAQLQLGHTGLATTQNHYIQGAGILARALDELPQPAAFQGDKTPPEGTGQAG